MARGCLLLLSLFVAMPSFAQITRVTFEPDRIDSHTPVVAHVRGFAGSACQSRSDVKINGTHIDLNVVCGGMGIAVPSPWGADVFIGILPAGTYDVVVSAGGEHRTLIVEDADPGFHFFPAEGRSDVNTVIVFDDVSPDAVVVGGRAAEKLSNGAFEVLPQPAGAVDVTIYPPFGGTPLTAKNGFRYYDAVAVDSGVWEPVLVPVILNGAGAFRSQWVTEVNEQLPNGDVMPITPGDHPHGYLAFIAHDAVKGIAFNARIRDVSREAQTFGTEIPVIRRNQFRGTRFAILDVPHDPRYRVTLRVYSLDPTTMPSIAVTPMNGGNPSFSFTPVSTPPASVTEPAYAEVNLDALIGTRSLTRVRLDMSPAYRNSEKLYWAFVSVTNNETQDVTILTPQ